VRLTVKSILYSLSLLYFNYLLKSAPLVSSKNEDNIDESNTEDLLEACFAQFGEDLDLDKLLE
jgi:hypothetical protein